MIPTDCSVLQGHTSTYEQAPVDVDLLTLVSLNIVYNYTMIKCEIQYKMMLKC